MNTTALTINRDEAIDYIRTALQERTGRKWSVKPGRGTVWGWIYIHSLPSRRNSDGTMNDIDRAILSRMFSEQIPDQGLRISPDMRNAYVTKSRAA